MSATLCPTGRTLDQCGPAVDGLIASLKRCRFLLLSTQLIATDPVARQVARHAAEEARKAIEAAGGPGMTRRPDPTQIAAVLGIVILFAVQVGWAAVFGGIAP